VAPFAAVLEKKMAKIILLVLALLTQEQIEEPEIKLQINIQTTHAKK
jgi:hypothetical protein